MKGFPLLALPLLLAACALSPEERAARVLAREAEERRLEVALAARCDGETARLIALQQQQWAGADAADRAAYAARVANPVFQSCLQMARENFRYEQELRELEDLEWRLEMRRETDWMMGRPFFRPPFGYWRR